jgi:hypothetical protein
LDHGKAVPAQIFSAHSVSRIGASLKKGDGYVFLAEAKAQSQACETPSDNGDGFQSILSAEKK